MSNFSNYNEIENNNTNNLRMIEINDYYSKRNAALIELFKLVIIGLIPLIIFTILTKSNIIPKQITVSISMIIIFALIVITFIKLYNISRRDPRNFDNYEIPFDPNQKILENAGKSSSMSDILSKEFDGMLGCFDKNCCSDGMKYDAKKRKCVLSSSEYNDKDSKTSDKDNKFIDSIDKLTNNQDLSKDLDSINNNLRNITLSNINSEL
jgi:hypothetical protein